MNLVVCGGLFQGVRCISTVNSSGGRIRILPQYESNDDGESDNHQQDSEESDIAGMKTSVNAAITEILPQDQRWMGGFLNIRPVFCNIFVLDFVMFAVASHTTSLAAADVHCIEELLFAIHALELDICVNPSSICFLFVLLLLL